MELLSICLSEGTFTYKIVGSYAEIEGIGAANRTADVQTICIVLSIEGMHSLLSDIDKAPTQSGVLKNLLHSVLSTPCKKLVKIN